MKKYKIDQYPKNKDLDSEMLSDDMKDVRLNSIKNESGETRECNKCFKTQPITEFYYTSKEKVRRFLSCRDCQMKRKGVVALGKTRFSIKIIEKGFRTCGICKNILPLNNFRKTKNSFAGYFTNCKPCDKEYYIKKHCAEQGINRNDYKEIKFSNRSKVHTKGQIRVTDLKTSEVFLFKNTKEKELLKMFSERTIWVAIKNGGLTKTSHNSKYKNPCKIERLF